MSIFDDITRDDDGSPQQGEGLFAYLNRSNRLEAARVRGLVDDWLSHYPEEHRDALVARFRSNIDDQHKSAFFELFLHEFVIRRGHKVIAIEPKLDHTAKSPDFLIERPDGSRYYLEAVMATGRSKDETAGQARLNQALAAIDSVPSPNHFLDLTVHGVPTAPVSVKKLKRAVREWVETLPDDESAKEAAPFVFEEHGSKITLRAWPRHKKGDNGPAIGVRHFPVQQVAPHEDVRHALKKKASRYGALDHPYVVAVNSLPFFGREQHVTDALLGDVVITAKKDLDGNDVFEEGRKPNGIWHGPHGARNTGLSAVLSFNTVDPWNFGSRRGQLIRNPWTTAVLPDLGLGTDELNPSGEVFERVDGSNMTTLLELPDRWPEE